MMLHYLWVVIQTLKDLVEQLIVVGPIDVFEISQLNLEAVLTNQDWFIKNVVMWDVVLMQIIYIGK